MKRTLFFILGILMCFVFVCGCSEFKGNYRTASIDEISAFAIKVSGKESVNYSKGVNIEFEVNSQNNTENKVFKVRAIDNGNGLESSGALIVKNGNKVNYTIEFWYVDGMSYTKTMYPYSEPAYASAQADYSTFVGGYVNGLNSMTLSSLLYSANASDVKEYFMEETDDATKVWIRASSDSENYYFVYDSYNRLQSIKVENKYSYGI